MKKYFETPEMNVQKFNAEDVITTSNNDGASGEVGGGLGNED